MCDAAPLASEMKDKDLEIRPVPGLCLFQLETVTFCAYVKKKKKKVSGPDALVWSYVWDKRCLFSLFHSCSLHTDEHSHPSFTPSPQYAPRENGVTQKSEVRTILS